MSIPEITHIVSLLEQGQTEQARPLLEDLIRQVPSHLSARVIMARLLEAQKDFDGALREWKTAAYLCPENPVIEKGLRKAVMRDLFAVEPVILASPPADRRVAPSIRETEEPTRPEAPEPATVHAPTAPSQVPITPSQVPEAPAAKAPVQPEGPATAEPALSQPDAADAGVVAAPTEGHGAESAPEFQDLDRLISELESARIVPDPDIKMIPQGELETEIDDVVSETLARIYANQKFFEEAASVYNKLAVQRPEKAEEFVQKAEEMRQKACGKA